MNDTNSLGPSSRVWIYHSNRPLTKKNVPVSVWKRRLLPVSGLYNQQLMAWAGVVEDRFVVLMVDESRHRCQWFVPSTVPSISFNHLNRNWPGII